MQYFFNTFFLCIICPNINLRPSNIWSSVAEKALKYSFKTANNNNNIDISAVFSEYEVNECYETSHF